MPKLRTYSILKTGRKIQTDSRLFKQINYLKYQGQLSTEMLRFRSSRNVDSSTGRIEHNVLQVAAVSGPCFPHGDSKPNSILSSLSSFSVYEA